MANRFGLGRWPLEALKQREESMPAIKFAREYLCEPIHDMSSMFPMTLLEKARDKNLVLLDKAEQDFDEKEKRKEHSVNTS